MIEPIEVTSWEYMAGDLMQATMNLLVRPGRVHDVSLYSLERKRLSTVGRNVSFSKLKGDFHDAKNLLMYFVLQRGHRN